MKLRQHVNRLLTIFLAVVFAAASFSCGNHQHVRVMTIQRIEIDIFSGRPNPGWTPSAADAELLQEHLSFEKELDCGPVPDALGYKGFILTCNDARPGLQQLRVFAGKLWNSKGAGCYQDIHQLEKLLIQQATKNGFAQLVSDLHL